MSRKHVIVMGLVMSVVFALTIPVLAQTATPVPTDPPSSPQPEATAETTAQPQPQMQQATTGFFVTTNFRLNVRSGPGIRYTKLGQLGIGDTFDVTGVSADGRWIQISFNGQEGWVSAPLVDVTGDISTAPVAEAGPNAILIGSQGDMTAANVIVVTSSRVDLRVAPFADADSLALIPVSTQLSVIGRNVTSDWVQVSYNNVVGWVPLANTSLAQGNLENVTMYDQAGNSVSATEPPRPTDFPATTATVMPTVPPTFEPTIPPTATP